MARTVVAGVDRSDAAEPVADAASWLASTLDTRLLVVHAVEEPVEEAEELLESVRARLPGGNDTSVRLVEASPADRLIEVADEEDAELLVVGSRGRGALSSAVLGGVSRKVARNARCPVLVVPPAVSIGAREGNGGSEGTVVCGVDGSGHAVTAAQVAGRLAERLGGRLLVVHARQDLKAVVSYPGARSITPPVTGQEDAVARQADRVVQKAVEALDVDVEATRVVESGAPAGVLAALADREDAHLIVIAARGMGAVRAAFLGSVTTALATSATRPVVVVSEPAELALVERAGGQRRTTA
jgi:nucleotide-binding universal stress UspA family protein